MKKINIITLGCSKNIYDSELLIGGLQKNNFEIVNDIVDANCVIVNTCGFLDDARKEGIETILEVEQLKNNGKIQTAVVMGCMSERFGHELRSEISNIDHYFGSNNIAEIIRFLCSETHELYDPDFNRANLTPNHYGYLKISEGCDNNCSFCSIPIMRGLQKSQPIEWNVQEAKRMITNGAKEILLIAQDSTAYGWDLSPRVALSDLLCNLNELENFDWLRLHYAHPAHLNNKIIECFKRLDKLVPYIDMPIQHASDGMLTKMRRGMKLEGIRRKIERLRNIKSDIAIRTSFIVGFPNESDSDFQSLYDFINEIKFDRVGVFTYSEEEGTYGKEKFSDNVSSKIKKERHDEIMKLQLGISLENNKKLLNTNQKVLIDTHTQDGNSIGRTFRDSPEIDNTVTINGRLKIGKFYNTKITEVHPYNLFGVINNA
ncbi:MAG: 30S ribosomal protein S12 methylthiotransferase RimO [Candidatus Marinimicrobia bacterium]|nr:30S ribosomal protein S12 methylthiotransferase RimO [Candidatus Neomarinimicrobiota bacterium]